VTERFSASVAGKQMACHASANLELAIPGYTPPEIDDTKASSKGTAMHHILELAGGYTTREMLGIAEAMTYVAKLRTQRRFKVLNEAHGTGWWLKQKPNTMSDVVLYVADEIHVVDYKFGKIPVDVVGNEQLKYYALAFAPLAPKATGVWVHVVQPFADNIEAVFITATELEQFRLDSIAAEAAILAGDLTFMPSDHCKFCPANPHGRGAKGKPSCPAMIKLLYPITINEEEILDEL
jgi:hypothetical protein